MLQAFSVVGEIPREREGIILYLLTNSDLNIDVSAGRSYLKQLEGHLTPGFMGNTGYHYQF